MSALPKELLDVAKFLATQPEQEAINRAIINRAYYAAYHGAKSFHASLPSPGSVGTTSGSHEQLIAALDNPTIPRTHQHYWTSKGVGKTLRLSCSARVAADYWLAHDVTEADARRVVGQSEEILVRTGHS